MKKVALVVPVFNVESYLRECLDSITYQTYENFIAYTIDDGSTDNSGKILDHFSRIDNRIYVIHQKNGGVSCARNIALECIEREGTFDYVGFVDSDDILLPTFIETNIKYIEETKSQYSVCGRANFDKHGIKKKSIKLTSRSLTRDGIYEHYFKNRSCGRKFEDPTVGFSLFNRFFSTELIKGIRFDNTLKAAEDIKYILTVFTKIEQGVIVPDILYLRRMRNSSISNSINTSRYDWSVAKEILTQSNPLPINARREVEKFLVNAWWNCVRYAYQTHDQEMDLDHLKRMYLEFNSLNLTTTFDLLKKSFMFSLGEPFLKFYFGRIRAKNNIYNTEYYK